MGDYLSVGQAAALLEVRPRVVSDAFYKGWLREDLAPVFGGRRLIPRGYVPEIERVLRRAGKMPVRQSA